MTSFIWQSGKGKIIETENWSMTERDYGNGEGLTTKEHEGLVGGDLGVEVIVGIVLYLICTGGYMPVCIYENSLNYEHKKQFHTM